MGITNTDIHIIEDDFVKENSSTYNLSILIGMDRFSYAIIDGQNLLTLKSYKLSSDLKSEKELHTALQDIFIEDKILKLPFGKTTVGLTNNQSTLVPNNFFQKEATNTYLRNQISSLAKQQVFIDDIKNVKAKNVYAYNQEIYFLVKGYLPNAHFCHSSTATLQGFLSLSQNTKKIYVNVKGDHLQIAFLDGKELVFYNAFSFEDEQNFIYHIVLIYNQFNLSTESVPTVLSGQITQDSKSYRILYRYINHIEFSDAPFSIRFGKKYQDIPTHFYFDLFSLGLCE